jgi:hypothetical protein
MSEFCVPVNVPSLTNVSPVMKAVGLDGSKPRLTERASVVIAADFDHLEVLVELNFVDTVPALCVFDFIEDVSGLGFLLHFAARAVPPFRQPLKFLDDGEQFVDMYEIHGIRAREVADKRRPNMVAGHVINQGFHEAYHSEIMAG